MLILWLITRKKSIVFCKKVIKIQHNTFNWDPHFTFAKPHRDFYLCLIVYINYLIPYSQCLLAFFNSEGYAFLYDSPRTVIFTAIVWFFLMQNSSLTWKTFQKISYSIIGRFNPAFSQVVVTEPLWSNVRSSYTENVALLNFEQKNPCFLG